MTKAQRIAGFRATGGSGTAPTTRFGGRPAWLAGPQRPVSAAWGRPMRFIGQIALGPVLGPVGEGRLAYLFVTHADHGEDFFDPDVIDPEGGENAVIVQPGGAHDGPVLPLTAGPTLYDGTGAPAAYTPDLRPAEETGDGDRIGGTPSFFQGDPHPGDDSWRLLLQLDTNWTPFRLHLGAAPRLFAFVSADGTRGRLLVQDS
ncbi:hypothetical protein ACIQRS_29815 [Streptomyces termitum]|uniref:DUF1963 domain-containing protein n=1 Tax=Streptomyces termitum TaxID=67368 RepID=A0A918TCK2_9ACTN|nr:hypothetical protein [Streptomyces termitum]GHB08025.1 hypothetical protein GCM10010305_58820 [Streptomyces termitum]